MAGNEAVTKSRGKLNGLQFISYAQLAIDVRQWSLQIPKGYFCAVAGLPRSGLTVAHMLSSHLNCPAVQIHARQFRQSSGRPLDIVRGPYLVVDDTASNGTAIIQAKREIGKLSAEFGVVYARKRAIPLLGYYFAEHKEPDWLVITEWNWFQHQDREYIAVTDKALLMTPGAAGSGFDAVYSESDDAFQIADQYAESDAAVLFCESFEVAIEIAEKSKKPVVCSGNGIALGAQS